MLVLNKAMELGVEVREIVLAVKRHDRSLADQMQRSMQSVVLNVCEARHARGKRGTDRFSLAYGEAKELEGALRIASMWGYVEVGADVMDRVDHVSAMLFKLSR